MTLANVNSRPFTERVARLIWWWTLRMMRRTPVGKFNHFIARSLSERHAKEFLERGRRQNAFARRHAVGLIRVGIVFVTSCVLFGLLLMLGQWLLDSGYLTAPKSDRAKSMRVSMKEGSFKNAVSIHDPSHGNTVFRGAG